MSKTIFNRLYVKIMLIILLISIAIVAVVSARGVMTKRNLAQLTKSYKAERQKSFEASLDSRFDLNRIFARDYSIWDDMIIAIQKEDDAWFDENITTALDTYKSSSAWVVGSDYVLKFSTTKIDQVKDFPLPIDFEKDAKEMFKDGYFVETFTTFEDKLYHIAISPVQPTNDDERKTAPQGFFITAKQLNGDFISQLEKVNQANIKINSQKYPIENDNLSQGVVNFDHILKDWRGDEVAQFNISTQSDFLRSLHQDANNRYWFFVVGIIISIAIYGLIVYLMISAPLRDVSDAIRYGGGMHLQKIIKRKDEIGDIAQMVQKNISQNEQIKTSYMKVEQAEQQASERLSEVQQVNSLMVGRELRMTELKKENEDLKRQLKDQKGKDGYVK